MNQRQFSEKFFDLDKLDLKDPSIYKTSFQGSQNHMNFILLGIVLINIFKPIRQIRLHF